MTNLLNVRQFVCYVGAGRNRTPSLTAAWTEFHFWSCCFSGRKRNPAAFIFNLHASFVYFSYGQFKLAHVQVRVINKANLANQWLIIDRTTGVWLPAGGSTDDFSLGSLTEVRRNGGRNLIIHFVQCWGLWMRGALPKAPSVSHWD
jgi:hypothetical protein